MHNQVQVSPLSLVCHKICPLQIIFCNLILSLIGIYISLRTSHVSPIPSHGILPVWTFPVVEGVPTSTLNQPLPLQRRVTYPPNVSGLDPFVLYCWWKSSYLFYSDDVCLHPVTTLRSGPRTPKTKSSHCPLLVVLQSNGDSRIPDLTGYAQPFGRRFTSGSIPTFQWLPDVQDRRGDPVSSGFCGVVYN